MPIKEFKVKTAEDEKVRRILERFSEVTIIGEEEEPELKPNKEAIEEKKARYKNLAGKAKEVGEDIKELVKLGNREETWREEEVEPS